MILTDRTSYRDSHTEPCLVHPRNKEKRHSVYFHQACIIAVPPGNQVAANWVTVRFVTEIRFSEFDE